MRARRWVAPMAAGVVIAGGMASGLAQAAMASGQVRPPAYHCATVQHRGPAVEGRGACAALAGAPHSGRVDGPFEISGRLGGRAVCRQGFAHTPDLVLGADCQRVPG